MSNLAVRTDSESITLKDGKGSKVFVVSNQSGQDLRVQAECIVLGDTAPDWLAIVDAGRKPLAPVGDVTFTVNVEVDRKAKEGLYKFAVRVADVENPPEYWGRSRDISFNVAAPPPPPPPPPPRWWLWAAIAAAIILAILALWLLWPTSVDIPDVSKQWLRAAAAKLHAVGLEPEASIPDFPIQVDNAIEIDLYVQSQEPAPGSRVARGTKVALRLSTTHVLVDGNGIDFDAPFGRGIVDPETDLEFKPEKNTFLRPGRTAEMARVPVLSMNQGGSAITAFDDGVAIVLRMLAGADNKITVAGNLHMGKDDAKSQDEGSLPYVLARYNPDGRLDTTFGQSGRAVTQAQLTIRDAALQPDGKILVAGGAIRSQPESEKGKKNVYVARFLPDGKPDKSFALNGSTTLRVGEDAMASSIALCPGGKIAVLARRSGLEKWALVSYNANGTLDQSFGKNGIAETEIEGGIDFTSYFGGGPQVISQSSGHLLVQQGAVSRFDPSGQKDMSFAQGQGVLGGGEELQFSAMALTANDGFVAVGTKNDSFATGVYTNNGVPDTGFNNGQVSIQRFDGYDGAGAYRVAVAPEGKILVAGMLAKKPAGDATIEDILRIIFSPETAAVRYNASGALDESLGQAGKLINPVKGHLLIPTCIAIQADGRTLASGLGASADVEVVRFLPDGKKDESFGIPYTLHDLDKGLALPGLARVSVKGNALETVPKDTCFFLQTNEGRYVLLRLTDDLTKASSALKIAYILFCGKMCGN